MFIFKKIRYIFIYNSDFKVTAITVTNLLQVIKKAILIKKKH